MISKKEIFKSAFNSSFILLGVFVLLDLLSYSFDLSSYRVIAGIVSLGLTIYLLIYLGRKYRNRFYNGYITYGRIFIFILLMVLFYSVFYSLYTFIFYNFFDPSRIETLIQLQLQQMEDWGMSEDMIIQKEEEIRMSMTSLSISIFTFLGTIGSGILFGAISALFIRKKEKISEVF